MSSADSYAEDGDERILEAIFVAAVLVAKAACFVLSIQERDCVSLPPLLSKAKRFEVETDVAEGRVFCASSGRLK